MYPLRGFTTLATKPAAFPRYLTAILGGVGVGACGVVGVILLTHEPEIRTNVESVLPWLVEVVRQRLGFPDEDQNRRAYVVRLERELFSDTVTVRAQGASVDLDPTTSVADACLALDGAHPLDLRADDLPVHVEEEVEEESQLSGLEAVITAHLGASLWSPPDELRAPTAEELAKGKREALKSLDARKLELKAQVASGQRDVDDANAELKAIDDRRRQLRGGFFSNLF